MTDFTPTPTLAVWFDIDDTLAYELDFCKSGFRAVAKGISDETAPYCSAEDEFVGKCVVNIKPHCKGGGRGKICHFARIDMVNMRCNL